MRKLIKKILLWFKLKILRKMPITVNEATNNINPILGQSFSFIRSSSDLEVEYRFHSSHQIDFQISYTIGGKVDIFYINPSAGSPNISMEDLSSEFQYILYRFNKDRQQIILAFQNIRSNRATPLSI